MDAPDETHSRKVVVDAMTPPTKILTFGELAVGARFRYYGEAYEKGHNALGWHEDLFVFIRPTEPVELIEEEKR